MIGSTLRLLGGVLLVLDIVDWESEAWLDAPLAWDRLGDPSLCELEDALPANLASLRRRISSGVNSLIFLRILFYFLKSLTLKQTGHYEI